MQNVFGGSMKSAIVILGPTASGKTQISIELSKEIGSEIISADSMQVYKFMDIGTAKPTEDEKCGVPHFLIDEVNPDEDFSVAMYKDLATKHMEDINKRGKIPVIAGGTGLYINSLLYNISFTETNVDAQLREKLTEQALLNGNKFLHDKLREVDPISAERIHENNVKRVVRALEVYYQTGKPISQHQEVSKLVPSSFRFIIIGLDMDRQRLYQRIDQRVDIMLEKGLVHEVKGLAEKGFDLSSKAFEGLGYKQILSYLNGEISLDEAVYIIKRDTRHYAKRQMTWFRKIEDVYWINLHEVSDLNEIIKKIKNHIAYHGIIL